MSNDEEIQETTVGSIPVVYVTPSAETTTRRLALWLPFLGGDKDSAAPFLRRLSRAGLTAVSFDPWQHGARTVEPPPDLMNRVFGHFRRDMWPILGQTTLDALHVLDWATASFDVEHEDIVAGGVSMGGDVSVALAGADRRISRVAAIVATPDWTRPGMTRVGEPDSVIDQGEPSSYGAWLYKHLDPITNQGAYRRGPAIAFELGRNDTHVPPAAALAFRDQLRSSAPDAADRMRITLHDGLDHLPAARDPQMQDAALAWLTAP